MREEMGYLEGGSDTFLDSLAGQIEAMGGTIHLNQRVREISVDGGSVRGVATAEGFFEYDKVISTVPMPYVADMVPHLPPDTLSTISRWYACWCTLNRH